MSDSGENKYKWTPESTSLLVSVWTDRQVQKQLEYATKPQLIWESVAKYMNKKGYNVNGKQCRSRMKHVLVCYREAKRAGTKAGVEQYYESIDRVLKSRRQDQGIDTVDSVANVKSPPKDIKTNKNLQMRYKYQQPPESQYRTEALSPAWSGRDEDYPDSPESNVTVLAQPFRVFSPVRDAATNTTQQQLGNINKKGMQQNKLVEETPIKESYRQSTYSNNYFSEIPFQNTVQNVQNQIIQESMQNQALLQQNVLQNQLLEQNRLQMNPLLRQNVQNINPTLYTDQGIQYNQGPLVFSPNGIAENVLKMQNKCQMNQLYNHAVPQEPRKSCFRQNLVANHPQFQDCVGMQNYNTNLNPLGILSPSISPDIPPNLNEGFCQAKNEKVNDAFSRPSSNPADMTTVTNNATFNDDTISIEFLQESPPPEQEPVKLKDFAVNTDDIPNAPFRKKKVEKLEKLMMSAINSQNEVVNKILAAQNEMVTRVLDLDRDRQNRLENRLDHLLDVVQTAVLNKSGELPPSPPEPLITNLAPPPKPGVIPPKLDLVPPKPCRVPCSNTITQNNYQSNNIQTRPGVVSPVLSPTKRVGAIWQKLGPVSTSPFVRAQQQLGFRPVHVPGTTARTQSSAERRIAKAFENGMDSKMLKQETANFLEAERRIVEEVENARLRADMDQELQSRHKLITQREPTAAMILSAAFIEKEIEATEMVENAALRQKLWDFKRRSNGQVYLYDNGNRIKDELLNSQTSQYERLRQLNLREREIGDPCNSSTPAKPQRRSDPVMKSNERDNENEPRQTIQQLAQLVMNSGRWRSSTGTTGTSVGQRNDLNFRGAPPTGNIQSGEKEEINLRKNQDYIPTAPPFPSKQSLQAVDGRAKTLDWLNDRYAYNSESLKKELNKRSESKAMGFTTDFLEKEDHCSEPPTMPEKRVGFVWDVTEDRKEKDPFEELQQMYFQQQIQLQHSKGLPFVIHNGKVLLQQNEIVDKFMQELYNKNKQNRDSDSENDEEFLDTTANLPSPRKNSLTSDGSKKEGGCIVS